MQANGKGQILSLDARRDIIIPGSKEQTLHFCVEHFIELATAAISKKNKFCVALSGGSTPKTIFQKLTSEPNRSRLNWAKVFLFWSDERAVPATDPESNYKMAMDAGFSTVPIPKSNIFRMPAENKDLQAAAQAYEKLIIQHVPGKAFDLIMLGMGDDGHTASLFPKTHALQVDDENRLVVANFVPQNNVWRLTLTFHCINAAHHIAIYVLGQAKAEMVKSTLTGKYEPDRLPVQQVGTHKHKVLWIADEEAASLLPKTF